VAAPLASGVVRGIERESAEGIFMGQQFTALADSIRQNEIPENVSRLADEIQAIGSTINGLLQRLEPVLRSQAPEVGAPKALKEAAQTALGSRLSNIRDELHSYNSQLEDALRRLEL
jgi:phage-related minor tail protein